jgi:hypothetical protein
MPTPIEITVIWRALPLFLGLAQGFMACENKADVDYQRVGLNVGYFHKLAIREFSTPPG